MDDFLLHRPSMRDEQASRTLQGQKARLRQRARMHPTTAGSQRRPSAFTVDGAGKAHGSAATAPQTEADSFAASADSEDKRHARRTRFEIEASRICASGPIAREWRATRDAQRAEDARPVAPSDRETGPPQARDRHVDRQNREHDEPGFPPIRPPRLSGAHDLSVVCLWNRENAEDGPIAVVVRKLRSQDRLVAGDGVRRGSQRRVNGEAGDQDEHARGQNAPARQRFFGHGSDDRSRAQAPLAGPACFRLKAAFAMTRASPPTSAGVRDRP